MKKFIFWENNPLVKETEYQIFNSKHHDTKLKFYWVSALCKNCYESCQVAIPQKEAVDFLKINQLLCPKCCCKQLNFATWNGQKYEVVQL